MKIEPSQKPDRESVEAGIVRASSQRRFAEFILRRVRPGAASAWTPGPAAGLSSESRANRVARRHSGVDQRFARP